MTSWEKESPPPVRKNRGVLSSMIVRVPENEIVGDTGGTKKEEKSSHWLKSVSPPLRKDRFQPLVDGSGVFYSPRNEKKKDRLPYDSGFNDREWAEHGSEGFKVINDVGRLRSYSSSYRCGGRDGRKAKDNLSPYKHRTDKSHSERFRERSPNYVHGRNGRKFRESSYGHGRIGGRFQQIPTTCDCGMVIRRFQDISFANEQDRDGVRFHNSYPTFKLKRNRRSQFSPAFERRKCGGSYRGHSPPYGNGRDARLFERCISDLGPEIFSFRKEGDYNNPYISPDYNNPYISPRVGNCFCENPLCGNMNSRRGTCHVCDENRYSSSNGRMHGSPYPYEGVFLDNLSPHVDPGPTWRETNGYRSPPNCRARHQQRYSTFIRHKGRRLPEVEYHEDMGNRMDGKFFRPLTQEGGSLTRHSWIQETNYPSLSPKKVDPAPKNRRM